MFQEEFIPEELLQYPPLSTKEEDENIRTNVGFGRTSSCYFEAACNLEGLVILAVTGSQSVVLVPAASASSGSLLEIPSSGSTTDPLSQETEGGRWELFCL